MRNRILVLVLFLFSIPYIVKSQQGQSPGLKEDSLAVVLPQAIPIVDVNNRIEETRIILSDKADEIELPSEVKQIDSLIGEREEFLRKEAREFREFNPYNLSKFFLENSYRAWEGYHNQLDEWQTYINNQIGNLEDHISDLSFIRSEWNLTMESLQEEEDEVEELEQRINRIIFEVDSLLGLLNDKSEDLISLEAEITDAMSFSDEMINDVDDLQQHLRDSLFIASENPIWQIKLRGGDMDYFQGRMNKFWGENSKIFRNYFQSLNLTTYLIILVILVLLFIELRRWYFKLGLNEEVPGYVNAKRIILKKFYPTLFALLLFLFVLMFPYNPLAFSSFLSFLLLICIQSILREFIGKNGIRIISLLLILLIINQLEIIMWYFSDWARLFVFLETSLLVISAFFIIHPLRRKILMQESPFMRGAIRLAYIVFILGAMAFLANIFGFVDLAVLLQKVAIESSVLIIIVFGLTKVLKVILVSFITILRSTKLSGLHKYLPKFETRSLSVINILAVIYLLSSILATLEIRRPVLDYLMANLEHKWVIGTLNVSIGGILLLVLILLLTYVLSQIFKVIIEDEIGSRVRLPKGVPFAISVTIRYFIIILGFVFALSAAGIDLGEFGLIAGALGIGIGFGLQNIVGNFISGLILIYERPVQNGDTVEVENLLGEVKKIGIRSSNVRTYDGAEVVVPNSNLVSNQLINWTLSDRRKRIEIKVGVAYGSDPNVVLELLKKVAREHEDVLDEPEPLALFEGFGDSSLNFRLLFWVYFDKGFTTRSDVAVGIYNILAENNITIPFPQMDVYLKRDE